MRKRGKQIMAGGGALLLTSGAAGLWSSSARAAAPDTLAVFDAASTATPVGVISRVPVETDGGYLLSNSAVQIGKSQALAAGFTLGSLGDAFVVTSAPPGTITQFPSVITAQDPPSATAPREAQLSGGDGGGASVGGEARNADLNARASDSPMALANASGQSISSAVYSTGAAVSHSESSVLPDGTVTTKGTTSMQNVMIGGPTGLTIASVDSLASIVIKPGQKPVTGLAIHTFGAQLAGVPVIIDQNGIRISDQVPVPASAVTSFNMGLAALAAQGLTFIASTVEQKVGDDQAEISGAAFTFRYHLPDSQIPRPSDIGSDETFEYGRVLAAVTARQRGDLGAGPALPPPGTATVGVPLGGGTPAAVPVAVGAPAVSSEPPATAVLGVGPAPAVVPTVNLGVASDTAEATGFTQPYRPSLAPQGVKDGYRYLLLVGALGLSGLVVLIRKRPIA
jgi:hypothetical protein